jgi:heat shock protein HtpX
MMNQIKTILLLGLLSALVVGVGAVLFPKAIWFFVAGAVVLNLWSWFFSDKLALRASRAQEVPEGDLPRVRLIVADVARAAGVPTPRLYLIPSQQPNAFATGRNPEHAAVAVTEGILQLLDERELKGVIAHEMSHVKNRDILVASVAAALAAAITYMAQLSFLFGGDSRRRDNGGTALLMVILAPLASLLVQMGVSRQREYLADETGAYLTGDPLALASALGKLDALSKRVPMQTTPATASLFIVNPFGGMGRSLANMFSTHPPIEQRIARLQELAKTLRGVAH